MLPLLGGLKNIDIYEIGKVYDYGQFQISPVELYHDVENCGYRIFKDGIKVFHATDTYALNGIEAKDYDIFAIEHNYDEDTVYQIIERQESQGKFAHQKRSINSHLSEQQARDFIFKNRKETSEVIRLHESKTA
jgi:L-ascorbate metabolism protein UlaG (beta-lactamase superfamily)